MCHMGLCTSSVQERANRTKFIGVYLIPNDEEEPEVDQHASREVYFIVSPNELEIDTTQDSRNKFSKSDQQQARFMHRFKYVEYVPVDSIIMC